MLTPYQLLTLRWLQAQRDCPGLRDEPPTPTLEGLGIVDHKHWMAGFSAGDWPVDQYLARQQRAEAEREFRRME